MLDENGEETENVEKALSIKTDYLSKEQEDEQFYICHDGRELRHIRTEEKEIAVCCSNIPVAV